MLSHVVLSVDVRRNIYFQNCLLTHPVHINAVSSKAFFHWWPMTSFSPLSWISYRAFSPAVTVLSKGATGSLLISEWLPCFKCVCWDRGRERRCISSQERLNSVISLHYDSLTPSTFPPPLVSKDMRSADFKICTTTSTTVSTWWPVTTHFKSSWRHFLYPRCSPISTKAKKRNIQSHPIVKDDIPQVKLIAEKELGVTDFTQICPILWGHKMR